MNQEIKKYHLYVTVRVDVNSRLDSLSDTIQEFEQATNYHFSDAENVKVTGMEILKTQPFKLTK